MEWMNLKIRNLVGMLLLVVVLAACNSPEAKEAKVDSKPENVKILADDYGKGKYPEHTASITSKEIQVTDKAGNLTTHSLPEDEFFVSIAPFINETHPCDIHSLTGCQGELVDVDFQFYVEDESGNVVIDETYNSEANGFVDIWLPRDKTFTVKVTYDGKVAESEISTFETDGTCITTMQLL